VSHSFGYIPWSGIAGSYGRSMFRFFKKSPNFFPEWLHYLAFPPAVYEGYIFPTFSLTPVFVVFLMMAILTRLRWNLNVVFDLHFLYGYRW
jgi:hypothetical protein